VCRCTAYLRKNSVLQAKYNILAMSIIRFFIFFLLFCTLAYSSTVNAQNRSVAVVYDNSGSMKDAGQCEGINYAMQVMVGLLHPNDELYVFKMQPPKGDPINLKSKRSSIQIINDTYTCNAGSTPYQAINNAATKLKASKKGKKWLIVLSDGEIQSNSFPKNKQTLRQFVEDTGTRIIFLNVNKNQSTLDRFFEQTNTPQKTLRTSGSFEQVIQTMEQIASSVMTLSDSGVQVNMTGSNQVTIDALMPLKRIIVLQQDTRRSTTLPNITEANANNTKLSFNDSYQAQKAKGNYRMKGQITHIVNNNKTTVIPKGDVNITFDATVNVRKVKFLPEAAAKLVVSMEGRFKGQDANVYTVCDSIPNITLVAKIVDLNERPLDDVVLKDAKVHYINEEYNTTHTMKYDPDEKRFIANLPISKDRFVISVAAAFEGYFDYQSNVLVVTRDHCPIPVASLTANAQSLKANVLDMANAPSLRIQPLIKEANKPARKPTAWELKNIDVELSNDALLGLNIKRNKQDGTITVSPTTFLCACFTATGKETLQLQLSSKSKHIKIDPNNNQLTIPISVADASFWAKCGWLIITGIMLLILFWYIIGLIKKPRFCRGSEIILSKESHISKRKPKSYPLPTGFIARYLIPYTPEKRSVGSVNFKAGSRCSHVLIARETQNIDMTVSGFPVETPNKKDLRLSHGERLEIQKRSSKEVYEYRKL